MGRSDPFVQHANFELGETEPQPEPLEDAVAQELSRIVAAYGAEALEHAGGG